MQERTTVQFMFQDIPSIATALPLATTMAPPTAWPLPQPQPFPKHGPSHGRSPSLSHIHAPPPSHGPPPSTSFGHSRSVLFDLPPLLYAFSLFLFVSLSSLTRFVSENNLTDQSHRSKILVLGSTPRSRNRKNQYGSSASRKESRVQF